MNPFNQKTLLPIIKKPILQIVEKVILLGVKDQKGSRNPFRMLKKMRKERT